VASPDPRPAQSAGKTAKRGYLLPGTIALGALVVIGLVINFSFTHHTPRNLDGQEVSMGIAEGLQAQERSASPPEVSCPPSRPLQTGLRFTCTRQRSGGDQVIEVTEINNIGGYRRQVVGPPGGG
jgi:hypothetical protein